MKRDARRRPAYPTAPPDRWACTVTVENATNKEKDALFKRVADLAFEMFENRADVSGCAVTSEDWSGDDVGSGRDAEVPDYPGTGTD